MGQCTMQDCGGEELHPAQMQTSTKIQYNGSKFILPQEIEFSRQSTFMKVEKAASSFCEKNNISNMYIPLLSRIIAYRHQVLFQEIFCRLPEAEKQNFLEDLNSVEHDLMDSFYHHFIRNPEHLKKDRLSNLKIAIPRVIRESEIKADKRSYLQQCGHGLIRENRVAVVLMCAGSSSRCDNQDKFLIPLNVKGSENILDIFFNRLQKNTGSHMKLCVIIGCNEFNMLKLQEYVKAKQYYGFEPGNFRYVQTYSLAVFDMNGKYCLSEKKRLIRRPSGTAATAEEVLQSSIYSFLKSQGVKYVNFCGLENLLVNPCDPIMIGIIETEKKKALGKCTSPYFQFQPLPRYFQNSESGRVELVNGQDLKSLQDGKIIQSLPIALNSMVFQLQSLRDLIFDYNNNLFLAQKYHVIRKKEPILEIVNGGTEKKDCYSFQKDLRDVMACVKDPLLYKVTRNRQFAPIYSLDREYALSQAQKHFKQRLEDEMGRKDSRLKYFS